MSKEKVEYITLILHLARKTSTNNQSLEATKAKKGKLEDSVVSAKRSLEFLEAQMDL